MKSNFQRGGIAILIVCLFITITITDINYSQKLPAEDERTKSIKQDTNSRVDSKVLLDQEVMIKQKEEIKKEMAVYSFEQANFKYKTFINKVDGYRVIVPNDMKADMTISNVRAVLENREQRIEIYRQKIEKKKDASVEAYYNYSNRFIDNNIDHKKENEGMSRINGRDIYFLEWSRRPLEYIENDKCYYASVEVPLGKYEVITFLFKSRIPFQDKESYLEVIRTFQLLENTQKLQEPYVRKIKQTENLSWDEKTTAVYNRYFSEESPLTWGIFETKAPVEFDELFEIERKVDYKFPVLLYYTGFIQGKDRHPRVAAALENAGKENRLVELTLQTVEQFKGRGNMVYDVLDGKYDEFLKNYVNDVVKSEYPVLFRLGNEMNGDWCVYSAYHTAKDTEIYKAFYRYIYHLFQEAGADNVIWVWNPNGESFPDFKWNNELCYYPGDEYVDIIGLTSYNTGTYYEGETWREFGAMYDPIYESYIELYQKPLMITEFASSSVGGNKATWIKDMFQHIAKYDRIKVAIWWDGCDWDIDGKVARPYFIDETEEIIKVFKENFANYK